MLKVMHNLLLLFILIIFFWWPTCRMSTAITSDCILPIVAILNEGLCYTTVGSNHYIIAVKCTEAGQQLGQQLGLGPKTNNEGVHSNGYVGTNVLVKSIGFIFLTDFLSAYSRLQCCVGFCHRAKWTSYTYTHIPSSSGFLPLRYSHSTEQSSLNYRVGSR